MQAPHAQIRFSCALLLAVASLIGGCAALAPSPAPPPSPPTIQTVGILAEERDADSDRTYVLADGRTVAISIEQTRVLFFGGGLGQPFVAGTDALGPFVATFLHQDGLPEDCHLPALRPLGIERGDFVEIAGVLWRKAPTFHSPAPLPALGEPYDTATRFCFDDQGEVAYIVPG